MVVPTYATKTLTMAPHDSRSQSIPAVPNSARLLVAISVGLISPPATYATLFCRRSRFISWADQTLFATNGVRIVGGQMPYRDNFQFVTPGTDLFYAFLFRSFGLRLWIPNLTMV